MRIYIYEVLFLFRKNFHKFLIVQLFLSKCPWCVMFLTSHVVLSLVLVCSEEVFMTIMLA